MQTGLAIVRSKSRPNTVPAALQGLAGGNIAGALAEASAPVLANIIDHHAGINDDIAAKAIAHAILDSVTTAHKGNGVRIHFGALKNSPTRKPRPRHQRITEPDGAM